MSIKGWNTRPVFEDVKPEELRELARSVGTGLIGSYIGMMFLLFATFGFLAPFFVVYGWTGSEGWALVTFLVEMVVGFILLVVGVQRWSKAQEEADARTREREAVAKSTLG